MKAVVAAFNQEKALVGASSVITNLRMELFQALLDIVMMMTHLPARAALARPVHGVAAALVLTLTRARAVRPVQARRTRRVAPKCFLILRYNIFCERNIFVCVCKVKFLKVVCKNYFKSIYLSHFTFVD